jgi:aryl-alcohol dehydrogenase-like predicted oxidoreductase
VETIDLYQIHWPNPEEEMEEGWEALARFREQGKIRWIGVSNVSVWSAPVDWRQGRPLGI